MSEPIREVRPLDEPSAVWLVRSSSPTFYLLDTRGTAPVMMRVSGPDSHSIGWMDGRWRSLRALTAGPVLVDERGIELGEPGGETTSWTLRVGSRHRWQTFDEWWVSRVCTALIRLDDEQLAEALKESTAN